MSQHNDKLLGTKGLWDKVLDRKVAIIATEWNADIVGAQMKGARKLAKELGIIISQELSVPGSVELPYAIQQLIKQNDTKELGIDAIIAFGAVIRGGTPHFDFVCQMVSDGINHINLHARIPVIFGVLTVDNEEQAWERLGGIHGHKGEEAMITAAKMIAYRDTLDLL